LLLTTIFRLNKFGNDSLKPENYELEILVDKRDAADKLTVETPSSSASKLGYIDSIRGIASLAVVVHHAFAGYEKNIAGVWLDQAKSNPIIYYCMNGGMQVRIFFVLSGRVLAGILLRLLTLSLVPGQAERRGACLGCDSQTLSPHATYYRVCNRLMAL
jgi:hypothetical protein